MLHYLIVCRSLTYAQKVLQILERGGIQSWMIRSPVSMSHSGCSYSVKIAQKDLPRALALMNHFHLPYIAIYLGSPEEGYREVDL